MNGLNLPTSQDYPYVLRVQAVLAPRRGDAVVKVRARSAHVQLLLVGLGGDIIPGLRPFEQELGHTERQAQKLANLDFHGRPGAFHTLDLSFLVQ